MTVRTASVAAFLAMSVAVGTAPAFASSSPSLLADAGGSVSSSVTRSGEHRIRVADFDTSRGEFLVQPTGDRADPTSHGLSLLRNGAGVTFHDVDFGSRAPSAVKVRLASAVNAGGGSVVVRQGGVKGQVIGSVVVEPTGSWQDFATVEIPLNASVEGVRNISLTFSADNADPFVNVHWMHFQFSDAVPSPSPTAVPSPTATASPTSPPVPTASPTPLPSQAPSPDPSAGPESPVAPGPSVPAQPSPEPTATAPVDEAGPRSVFPRIEAEDCASASGPILRQPSGDREDPHNHGLALLRAGSTVTYGNVEFGSRIADAVDLRISSAVNTGQGMILVRDGGITGPIVGAVTVAPTASWQDYTTVRVALADHLSGTRNLSITFVSHNGDPFVNLNWFQFSGPAGQDQPVDPTPSTLPVSPSAPAPEQTGIPESPAPTVSPAPSSPPPSTAPTPQPVPTIGAEPTEPPALTTPGLIVKLVNNTGHPDRNVYVTTDTGGNGNAHYSGSVGDRFQPGLGNGVRLTELNGPGTDPASHTYTFVIHGNSGGRVYYSIGEPFVHHWPAAHDAQMQFDIAEINITNGVFYGNLSAVDQVGIPSRLRLLDSAGNLLSSGGGPAERNIACSSEVYEQIQAHAPAGWDPANAAIFNPDGSLRRLVAPNADATRHPSLQGYVESLAGQTLRVRGRFAGGPAAGAAAYYDYSARVDAEGNVYLTGTLRDADDPSKPNASYPKPATMFVAAEELYGQVNKQFSGYGIYLQNGPYTLDGQVTGDGVSDPYRLASGTGHTDMVRNDIYGWIYGDLVTAYAFGYWGGKYGNDSANFHGKPAFDAARTAPEPFMAWSVWQQAIWLTSDSYGMSLGERYEAAGKASPLIGIYRGVQTVEVTMKGDCPLLQR